MTRHEAFKKAILKDRLILQPNEWYMNISNKGAEALGTKREGLCYRMPQNCAESH